MHTVRLLAAAGAATLLALAPPARAFQGRGAEGGAARMSSMGQLAAESRTALTSVKGLVDGVLNRDVCVNSVRCPHFGSIDPGVDDLAGPRGGQAETSIAVDATGQHVVVGFNDTRGFARDPISVSGFMYSDDGGRTFVDGGQLPAGPPGSGFPQVFGDPELKYLGQCNFVYSSILVVVKELVPGTPVAVQTMGVHRSRDCGHTWEGPFEVTAATNPNGQTDPNGEALDAADKEFMDFSPRTGRVLMSWTNFTDPSIAPGQVQMMAAFSDDLLTATPPTWSTAAVVSAEVEDGQSSVPRFGPDGRTAYVAWRRFPFPGVFFGFGNTTAVARSADGGATWAAPVETSPEFFTMDYVLGNDRVNTSPSLSVDTSRSRHAGTLYLVYANNDSGDGADIAFQRSADGGRTWSPTLFLNSRPGDDRAQWFPWVTVDAASGRVFAFWYDQGVADSGDVTQVSYTFSEDGGRRWSAPARLSPRTFHAGWGNDTGQPNLGDYNQAVFARGSAYASFSVTSRPEGGFVNGQPSTGMDVPDAVVNVLSPLELRLGAPIDLRDVVAFDDFGFGANARNGFVDRGEAVALRFTIRNSSTNPLHAGAIRGLAGLLTTSTPGVLVVLPVATFPDLAPGAAAANRGRFAILTTPAFVPGTPIELALTVAGSRGTSVLRHTLLTGTPRPTTLFTETFDLGAPGWTAAHGGGVNVVPWTVRPSGFCGQTSPVAFHQNANDGPGGVQNTRWERLFSPPITVPADAEYVTVDFDVCTDTEEDPNFRVLAYDGFFLRVTDLTPGRTLRSVLAEAFDDEFTTGDLQHYPRHLPRNSNLAYFEDMSAWAGESGGFRHVRMRLPGTAGSVIQLRFEFTQDGVATCQDLRPGNLCGVAVDNVVVRSVTSAR